MLPRLRAALILALCLLKKLEQADDAAHEVDWRLHDIQIVPVASLEEEEEGKTRAAGA
ncbi:MAG TPA: hypothetical protein VNZ44_11700 [Pyrinomonadaceae bacterium]|nr:hypothetical protein [Pyrinomonadaceae bacterium]